MAFTPGRGHEALRRGRWSVAGAEYFVSICTDGRKSGLSKPGLLTAIFGELHAMEGESIWQVATGVIMPDHIHLVFEIGSAIDLAGAMRLFKGRLTPVLRTQKLEWQDGYFDHRMREGEDRLPVFLYILLNPYRANLVPRDRRWPGYFCAEKEWG